MLELRFFMQIQADNIIILVIGITIIFLCVAASLILYINIYNDKKRKHQQEKEAIKQEFSQTLLQSQLEIREQTMRHISHELHDNLGQIASLIKINLNTIQLSEEEKAAQKIENTKELTRTLISDIKTLSVSLGSDHLSKTGLIKALRMEADRINKTGVFEVSFIQETDSVEISPDHAIILYRMVQEILNNCVKHSDAKHVSLSVGMQQNQYQLSITDDGRGFNLTEAGSAISAGFKNLHYRAQLINAQLTVTSTVGNGTQVTILWPI